MLRIRFGLFFTVRRSGLAVPGTPDRLFSLVLSLVSSKPEVILKSRLTLLVDVESDAKVAGYLSDLATTQELVRRRSSGEAKSADGRVATEAAWLIGNNLKKEKTKKRKKTNGKT